VPPWPNGQKAVVLSALCCQYRQYGYVPDPDSLRPDRFYVMSDAGSLYWDETCPAGFETPEAAAEWARGQTRWAYGAELDFSDGATSVIVLGGEVNAANAAWQAWADAGGSAPYPEVEVRNYASDLGLVTDS
jgi:hypothetical protein